MYRVKIYGAGSIGNHLAHAARHLGWSVTVCDVSDAALARMQHETYPGRYGQWDTSIQLATNDQAPRGGFDFIFIGTPPDVHLPLAIQAMQEQPKGLLIEKPACPPSLERALELHELARVSSTKVFVGYDHVVGKAAVKTEEMIKSGMLGEIQTIDVEFREHWGGIFAAHPWLSGPEDSYLGYWQRGGGASGEHSHALNLWQHLAHVANAGRVVEVNAMLHYVQHGRVDYDDLCLTNLQTEAGLIGRVVQDVVTTPHRKRARVQGTNGAVEWVANYSSEGDAVILLRPGQPEEVSLIQKRRPDDFIQELQHLQNQLAEPSSHSPIRLERGLDTMLVVAAAHYSAREKCTVAIDYAKGYTAMALSPATGATESHKKGRQ